MIARHPGRPGLLLVKRAARRQARGWWLESDNPGAGAVDSRAFGAVPPELIEGRVVLRYWPPGGADRGFAPRPRRCNGKVPSPQRDAAFSALAYVDRPARVRAGLSTPGLRPTRSSISSLGSRAYMPRSR